MTKRNAPYVLAGLVSVVTLLVYLVALRNGFVNWDDNVYVYDNPSIRSLDAGFFRWAFSDVATSGFWHPLVWVSYGIDYALWGLNPAGHHLTSILLHAVNSFLVVVLVIQLVEAANDRMNSPSPAGDRVNGRPRGLDRRSMFITAGATGLFFGLHPLHVESVAWISERKDLLCALFYLLSMLSYVHYAISRRGTEGDGRAESVLSLRQYASKPFLGSLVLFVLALAGKSMAVTLPAVLLLLDWYPLARMRSLRSAIALFLEKIPFVVLSALFSIISLAGQRTHGALESGAPVALSVKVLVAVRALIAYLGKMVFPAHLLPFYPYPENPSLFSAEYLTAVVLAGALTAVCVLLARRQRVWLLLWGYYIVTLLPVLGVIRIGTFAMADRFTYLPSLGPFVFLGLSSASVWNKADSCERAWQTAKYLAAAMAIGVCVTMVYLTLEQISVWKNGVTLWSYLIEHEPTRVPSAYESRANALKGAGQPERAIEDYTRAIALDGTTPSFYNNRGLVYREMGLFDLSLEDHDRALALKPDLPDTYNNRGLTYKEMGQFDRAIADFTTAIRLDPPYADAYTSRGWTYQEMGQTDRAMEDYDKAIEIDPTRVVAFNDRGIALLERGLIEAAIEDFTRAIKLNPLFAEAFTNRGLAFEQAGQVDAALADYTSAIKAEPTFANAYNNRGLIFERTGRLDRALEDFTTAIRLSPSSIDAYNNRGLVYEDLGQFDRAVDDYDRSIALKPDDYLSYSNRGIALAKMGRFEKAIHDQTKAITLKPDFAQAYIERGTCYEQTGRGALAKTDLQKACALGYEPACRASRQRGASD